MLLIMQRRWLAITRVAGKIARSGLTGALLLVLTGASEAAENPEPPSKEAIARAEESVRSAIPRAEADPTRPVYHFLAPAQWMNDPSGPIYHRGYYHLFYQTNPYGDTWGHIHWGHARSRDLVRWQHLPIALWPSEELGEKYTFSGCALINAHSQPMIFYTSIAKGQLPGDHAQQWAALGSKDLVNWQKHPNNPILTESLHGDRKVYDWRDPFVFQDEGKTYMVVGGNLNQSKGGQAVVNLYRAENDLLTQWKDLGVLFTHPNPRVPNIECPNLFKLGSSWVLVVSPHAPVEYFVGDFDSQSGRFTARHGGRADYSTHFYAPNSLIDSRDRRIIWGWIRGFQEGRGWNGCLSLPRVLSLDAAGALVQKPAQEIRKLRRDHFSLSDLTLVPSTLEIAAARGDCLEIYAELELLKATSIELQVRRSDDGTRFIPIRFNGSDVEVDGLKIPHRVRPPERTVKLNLFLDKSVLELFVDNRACVTQVIYPNGGDVGVALAASGGVARVRSFHSWQMRLTPR